MVLLGVGGEKREKDIGSIGNVGYENVIVAIGGIKEVENISCFVIREPFGNFGEVLLFG